MEHKQTIHIRKELATVIFEPTFFRANSWEIARAIVAQVVKNEIDGTTEGELNEEYIKFEKDDYISGLVYLSEDGMRIKIPDSMTVDDTSDERWEFIFDLNELVHKFIKKCCCGREWKVTVEWDNVWDEDSRRVLVEQCGGDTMINQAAAFLEQNGRSFDARVRVYSALGLAPSYGATDGKITAENGEVRVVLPEGEIPRVPGVLKALNWISEGSDGSVTFTTHGGYKIHATFGDKEIGRRLYGALWDYRPHFVDDDPLLAYDDDVDD